MKQHKKIKALNLRKNELGILAPDLRDTASDAEIADFKMVVELAEETNQNYPLDYMDAYQTFIITVREYVWSNFDEANQRKFFERSQTRFWELFREGLTPDKCTEQILEEYDPRDWKLM